MDGVSSAFAPSLSRPRNVRGPVTEDGLRHIVRHLRPRDRDEIFALRWDDDEDAFVNEVIPACGAMCFLWERDGVPVAVQGAIPLRPGVWTVWAFGTASWPAVLLDMTRWARRFMIPALLRAGVHRAECRALMSHMDSRRWIEALGGRLEGVQDGCGRDGETYLVYVWRRPPHV